MRYQGPKFPFSLSGHLAAPSFPIALLSQFSHCIIKGPQIFHCVIKGSQFPHHVIKMMISNFPSHYQGVSIYHYVIKGPPLWPLISHHAIKESQFFITSSKRPKFPKYTMYMTFEIYGIFSKQVTPVVFFSVLWLIKLFHLLKTCNRIHFFLVLGILGELYTDVHSFLLFFCMISVVLPPEDLKTHSNAGSVTVVIYFRVLNICEKVNFILTLVFFFFLMLNHL